MTSTLATALNITWPASGNIPAGLGCNVHSQIIPSRFIRPLFDWVRFDLSAQDYNISTIQQAYNFYTSMGCSILWTVSSLKDVQAMVTAGIKNACIEPANEPDTTFPNRKALTPTEYIILVAQVGQYAHQNGYTVVGPSLATWDDLGFMLQVTAMGLVYFVDCIATHPYNVKTNHELWDNISMQRKAWNNKLFMYTEFCIGKTDVLPIQAYDQDVQTFVNSTLGFKDVIQQAAVLGSIAKQSIFEKISFCIYDMPSTNINTQLIDGGSYMDYTNAKPSVLYQYLFKYCLPSMYDQWMSEHQ